MKEISVKGFGTCLNLCYNFYCISEKYLLAISTDLKNTLNPVLL